ncbi:MAG: hypothetical protein SNJ67_07990 [Chloracidobacterium sp.]|uniref:Lipoprotein n=1 Tax=Chloracidobacterium validum TaxID=2821543 RepID=A0ABX8B683_9BACT|nr:hypothetical protein [Chloracidobacterium validum]QUW02487.1 hypothetical protein J8C06_09020 [Chloracidobacterium validum]
MVIRSHRRLLVVWLAWFSLGFCNGCQPASPPAPTIDLFSLMERFWPQFDGSRERAGQPPLTRQDAERLLSDARVERRWQVEGEQEVLTAVLPVTFGKGSGRCRVTVTSRLGQSTVHSVIFQLSDLTDPNLADDENHVIDAFVKQYGDPADVDATDIDLVWRLSQGALVLLAAEADDPTTTFALRPLTDLPTDDPLGNGGELRDHD